MVLLLPWIVGDRDNVRREAGGTEWDLHYRWKFDHAMWLYTERGGFRSSRKGGGCLAYGGYPGVADAIRFCGLSNV